MRWAMAWLCYWIGVVTWRCHLWNIYQDTMRWSDWWQGETDRGPWRAADRVELPPYEP